MIGGGALGARVAGFLDTPIAPPPVGVVQPAVFTAGNMFVLTNGGKTVQASQRPFDWTSCWLSVPRNTGKLWIEYRLDAIAGGDAMQIGIGAASIMRYQFNGTNAAGVNVLASNGTVRNNGGAYTPFTSYQFTAGDLLGMGYDATTGTLSFYRNGTLLGSYVAVAVGANVYASLYFYDNTAYRVTIPNTTANMPVGYTPWPGA